MAIVQLGPDTTDILCFVVTNAGDRRVKTLARRRYVPISRELVDLGIMDFVAAATKDEHRFPWFEIQAQDGDVTRVSGYFSLFWASFSWTDVGITSPGASLYAFQDRLAGADYGDEVKKGLMGHSDSGMTGRYGTKKKPRVATIVKRNNAIRNLQWGFLPIIKTSQRNFCLHPDKLPNRAVYEFFTSAKRRFVE